MPSWRRGNHAAAVDRAAAALDVALDVEFTYPLATCLETAALVLATDRAGGAGSADVGCLLASAASIRTAGDRPVPVTLAGAVTALRTELSVTDAVVLSPRQAAQLALRLLA